MKKQRMKIRNYNILLVLLLLLMGTACSTTRNLPEGEVLYTGIKDIHINRNDQSPMGEKALAEVEAAISIAPNNSFSEVPRSVFPSRSDYGYTTVSNVMKKDSGNGSSRNWQPNRSCCRLSIRTLG